MKYIHMLLAATFSVPLVAQADVLHDQPLSIIDGGKCSPCSSHGDDYRAFGSFSLSSDSILQSGRFAIVDISPPANGGDLSISIWDAPFGTELYSLTALAGSYTTNPPVAFSYYAEIDLPNWSLPAGSYWISLFGINDNYLGWGTDFSTGNDAQYFSHGDLVANDIYVGFTLFGEPVPEPSSLLIGAVASFMVRGRRQRGRFALGKF